MAWAAGSRAWLRTDETTTVEPYVVELKGEVNGRIMFASSIGEIREATVAFSDIIQAVGDPPAGSVLLSTGTQWKDYLAPRDGGRAGVAAPGTQPSATPVVPAGRSRSPCLPRHTTRR